MSVDGTIFDLAKSDCVLSDGTWTMIDWPGLKPSLRLNSVGSTGTPLALEGSSARVRATRRPVADVRSFLVCATFDGNGSRHPRFGVPLQVVAEAAEGSSRSAPIAPRSLRFIAARLNTFVRRELRSWVSPRERITHMARVFVTRRLAGDALERLRRAR